MYVNSLSAAVTLSNTNDVINQSDFLRHFHLFLLSKWAPCRTQIVSSYWLEIIICKRRLHFFFKSGTRCLRDGNKNAHSKKNTHVTAHHAEKLCSIDKRVTVIFELFFLN